MGILNFFNKNNKNKKQLTMEEKWNIDVESYKNSNYKVQTGETQCYNCIYMNKNNIFECSKLGSISSDILKCNVKCEYRKEK